MTSPNQIRIFRGGSTTYFYASLFFPREVRADVFALYAFVRTADDFVDNLPQDAGGLERFVRAYRAALAGQPAGEPVIDDFVALSRRRQFDSEWTESFLAAMRRDLERGPYNTIAELESYMYGSAEVIGLFLARTLGLPEAALAPARWQGKAMQYANFLRDVAEDHALGRTYIPQAVLAAHSLDSLTPEAIAAHPDRFAELMRHEIARYRRWQAQAEVGYAYLPRRVRAPIEAAARMYSWTMDELEADPLRALTEKIKPKPLQVMAEVARSGRRQFGRAPAWGSAPADQPGGQLRNPSP